MINKIKYLFFFVGSAAASSMKFFLYAKVLSPNEFAYFALLDLVAAFGLYAGSLGLLEGTSRKVAMLMGANRDNEANIFISESFVVLIILSSMAYFVFFISTLFITTDIVKFYLFTLMGLYAYLNNLFTFALAVISARGSYLKFSILLFARNTVALITGVVSALDYGIYGALMADLIVTASLSIYAIKGTRLFKVNLGLINLKRVIEAIRVGFPLMLSSLLQNLARHSERIVIGIGLGMTMFGQYSFATSISLVSLIILNMVTQVISPKLCKIYGGSGDLKAQVFKLDQLFLGVIASSILLYPSFLSLVDFIAKEYMSNYSSGFELMKVIYWGAVLQVGQIYQSVLFANADGWRLMYQSIIIFGISLVLCIGGVYFAALQEYYAWVFVFGRFVAFVLLRWSVSANYFSKLVHCPDILRKA